MEKIKSLYNQNRKIFWIVILTIIAVIALIQALNNYYKNDTKDESSSTNIGTTTYNANNYSVVTQEEIDSDVSDNSDYLLKSFFDYCNNGEIENAYNLLSTDCKEELYSTLDDFKQRYYNVVFTEKRSYDSALWITTSERNTYRVEIMADLLATGQKEYMPIEDYYTIVYENGEYKLSINNYIAKENIDVSKTQNDVTINVVSKKMYKDYETYEIEVENNTGNNLIFNTKENTDSIYLQDENKLKYIAFLNEIPDSALEISDGINKTIKMKFNRTYKPNIDINKIVFGDISSNGQKQSIEIEL